MLHTAKYMHQILDLALPAYDDLFKDIDISGLVENKGIIYFWTNQDLKSTIRPDHYPSVVVIQNTTKTCSLGSVFTSHTVEKMEKRRSSSGDWFSDRLTWREELRYKQDMGFAANNK